MEIGDNLSRRGTGRAAVGVYTPCNVPLLPTDTMKAWGIMVDNNVAVHHMPPSLHSVRWSELSAVIQHDAPFPDGPPQCIQGAPYSAAVRDAIGVVFVPMDGPWLEGRAPFKPKTTVQSLDEGLCATGDNRIPHGGCARHAPPNTAGMSLLTPTTLDQACWVHEIS